MRHARGRCGRPRADDIVIDLVVNGEIGRIRLSADPFSIRWVAGRIVADPFGFFAGLPGQDGGDEGEKVAPSFAHRLVVEEAVCVGRATGEPIGDAVGILVGYYPVVKAAIAQGRAFALVGYGGFHHFTAGQLGPDALGIGRWDEYSRYFGLCGGIVIAHREDLVLGVGDDNGYGPCFFSFQYFGFKGTGAAGDERYFAAYRTSVADGGAGQALSEAVLYLHDGCFQSLGGDERAKPCGAYQDRACYFQRAVYL